MTQDLCVERAAGNGAFFAGGACHFPKGCNTRRARSCAAFTHIWLGFTPSAFAIAPPALEHSEPSWCSKTTNSPHLVLFKESRRTALLPSSLLPMLSSDRRVWAGARLRSWAVPADEVHVSDSYDGKGMLAVWPLLRWVLPLPQAGA